MTWIFTFGFGQIDPRTGRHLDNCFVEVELHPQLGLLDAVEHARRQMLARFGGHERGGNWAFDYRDREAAGVARYDLTEIDFETGQPTGASVR